MFALEAAEAAAGEIPARPDERKGFVERIRLK